MEMGIKQGKTPIFVKDVPGFYGNRCLAAYLVEATAIISEGVRFNTIDAAMTAFGMSKGPVELLGTTSDVIPLLLPAMLSATSAL
jgi:3-hydroxyacyl-CoA dehydrogenase